MKSSLILIALIALFCGGVTGAPLNLNGTFKSAQSGAAMPDNWVQNKGNWFKPYGVVKFAVPNSLQIVTNDQKSVYIDETTRFAAAPDGTVTLSMQCRGSGSAGFLIHIYNSRGKRLWTLTSAQKVTPQGVTVKYSARLKKEYTGVEKVDLVPAKISCGIFIEKNSDLAVSDYRADYTDKAQNTTMKAADRTDWAAGTYRALTALAAKSNDVPLMFLGDSITQLWSFAAANKYPGGLEVWQKNFAPLGAVNFGVSGDMIQNVLWRITTGEQLKCKPRVIVLLIGTNNLHQQPVNSPSEITAGVENLLQIIKKQLPETKVLLLGILSRRGNYPIADINAMLHAAARRNKASFLDCSFALTGGKKEIDKEIFRDGLHLSPRGYEIFAATLLPEITRLLNTAPQKNMAEKKSPYRLYLAPSATVPEQKAAAELQYFWSRIFNATPEIVRAMPPSGPVVVLGQTPEAAAITGVGDFAALQPDEVVMAKKGDTVVLSGGRPRGTLNSVYVFLEDRLGVKFYSSYEQELPVLKKLDIKDFTFRYKPVIKARGSFFHDLLYADQLFAVRQRNNEDFLRAMSAYGCDIRFAGGVHTFDRFIPASKYLKSNPEFFSLRGGERVGGQNKGQLCLSNAAMRREFTANVLAFLRQNPGASMISVSQNDNTNPCECPLCRTETVAEGSPAGPVLRFVNQIAEAVEKEFPAVTIQTFAYQYTTKVPRTVRPRRNVEIRLCSIGGNFAAPLNSERNAAFRDELRAWSKVAPRLSIWNYVSNFANYLAPYPNLGNLGADIRFFAENNVCAVLEQGDWNSGGVTGDFVALKAWLISKLLWNPTLDPDKLIAEFCDGYYGNASPFIKDYLKLAEKEVAANGTYLGCFVDRCETVISPGTLMQMYKLMEKARAAVAAGEFKIKERVEIAALPVRFAMLERAVALKKKFGKELPDMDKLFYDTVSCALRNRTLRYQENKSFAAYIDILRDAVNNSNKVTAGKKISRPRCVGTSNDYFDMQETVRQESDPAASDGSAAKISGKVYTWHIQFHPSLDNFPMQRGNYRLFAVCRAELNDGKNPAGMGFEAGSYNRQTKKIEMKNFPLADCVGANYKEFDLGVHALDPNCYLYVAPRKNDAMKWLCVDRVIAIPAR